MHCVSRDNRHFLYLVRWEFLHMASHGELLLALGRTFLGIPSRYQLRPHDKICRTEYTKLGCPHSIRELLLLLFSIVTPSRPRNITWYNSLRTKDLRPVLLPIHHHAYLHSSQDPSVPLYPLTHNGRVGYQLPWLWNVYGRLLAEQSPRTHRSGPPRLRLELSQIKRHSLRKWRSHHLRHPIPKHQPHQWHNPRH